MPIILGTIFMFSIQYIHNLNFEYKSVKVDYILPENFRGEIIVYDNINCGIKETKKNDRIIINVPKNGIVYFVGDLSNKGYVDNKFKIKKGRLVDELINFEESMFQDKNRQEYAKNTIGVFNIGHYSYHNEKYKIRDMFLVTNKSLYDSINWYKIINNKINTLNQVECK